LGDHLIRKGKKTQGVGVKKESHPGKQQKKQETGESVKKGQSQGRDRGESLGVNWRAEYKEVGRVILKGF